MRDRMMRDVPATPGQAVQQGLEIFVKKAWSIMEAASEKQMPSHYLSDRAIRSIQGKE